MTYFFMLITSSWIYSKIIFSSHVNRWIFHQFIIIGSLTTHLDGRKTSLLQPGLYTLLTRHLVSNEICIGLETNNQAEYDAIIGLLANAYNLGICHLHVFLDS